MIPRILKMARPGLILVLAFGLMFGTALGGTEDNVHNAVSFSLGDASAYTYETSYMPSYEIATLEFQVAFDVAQAGYLQGASIRLDFDSDNITLAEARPVAAWGATSAVVTPTATGVVCTIDPPSGVSTVPISTTATTIVEFDFHVNCQEIPETTPVTIVYGPMMTFVDDGVDWHDVTEPTGRIDDGSVGVWDPTFNLWMLNTFNIEEYEGSLGTEIEVPLILGSHFKVASVDATVAYDINKLDFVGVTGWDPVFVDNEYSEPAVGQVNVAGGTDESQVPRRAFSPGTAMVNLVFRVVGNWQDDATQVVYLPNPVVEVALGDGTCGIPTSGTTHSGTLLIPEYEAEFTAEWLNGGTISDHDDFADLKIMVTNNFPFNDDLQAVITNLNLSDQLRETGGFTTYDLYYNGVQGFGAPGEEREISLQTAGGTSHLSASAEAQDLVAFQIGKQFGFEPPATFDDRLYDIVFQSPYDNQPLQYAQINDTTNQVRVDNIATTLTWQQPTQLEYLMGEYYCSYAAGGKGVVLTQTCSMRHNFTLDDFRVKITVTGAHHIYDLDLPTGVEMESFDLTAYKWVILRSNDDWTARAATTNRTQFATIDYAYSGASLLIGMVAKEAADLPDDDEPMNSAGPGNGYYVNKTSTVAFEDVSAGTSYMAEGDQTAVNQHYVGVGNSLLNRWWVEIVDPGTPYDNLDMFAGHGLPETYALFQNYPNPFNPTTDFWYGLPAAGPVEVVVYNVAGQKVATLFEGFQEAGYYRQTWNAQDQASGIYFYRLSANGQTVSKKMVLLK